MQSISITHHILHIQLSAPFVENFLRKGENGAAINRDKAIFCPDAAFKVKLQPHEVSVKFRCSQQVA